MRILTLTDVGLIGIRPKSSRMDLIIPTNTCRCMDTIRIMTIDVVTVLVIIKVIPKDYTLVVIMIVITVGFGIRLQYNVQEMNIMPIGKDPSSQGESRHHPSDVSLRCHHLI